MTNLVTDILDLGVDGIDISETAYGSVGSTATTFDVEANETFSNRYPAEVASKTNAHWLALRNETLTSNLYECISKTALDRGKQVHFTYTWTANSNGTMRAPSEISSSDGIDFSAIMSLPGESGPSLMAPEVMWQQWKDNYTNAGSFNFTPSWTTQAIAGINAYTKDRVLVSAHIERGPVGGPTVPTSNQFEQALGLAMTNASGVDIYSHHLIYTNGANVVSNIFRNSP